MGKRYDILVDDEVPIFNPIPGIEYNIMAENIDKIMWGPLLEKGYAKFAGSYEKISKGGTASEAIRAMTGFPGFVHVTRRTPAIFDKI